MKVKIQTETAVDHVRLSFPIRHPEDFTGGDDCPGRTNDRMNLVIRLSDGAVKDWPAGRTVELHEKVVDEGTYALLDGEYHEVIVCDDGYVPSFLPGEGYGDYVILNIGADGKCAGWKVNERAVQEWVENVEDSR